MNKLLSLLLSTSIIFSLSANHIQTVKLDNATVEYFDEPLVFVPEKFGSVQIYKDNGTFHIIHEDKDHSVKPECLDKALRTMNDEQLVTFLHVGYISVTRYSDGEWGLKSHVRGKGGGVWGWICGAYGAKFLTHFVAHGTILIIGACTGPAAPATIAALEATFLPTIEAASTVAALAGGIAGGVATGPV